MLAHGQWFSPGTLASSTTKTGRHDIAEILLKVALNTINQSKISEIYEWNYWLNMLNESSQWNYWLNMLNDVDVNEHDRLSNITLIDTN